MGRAAPELTERGAQPRWEFSELHCKRRSTSAVLQKHASVRLSAALARRPLGIVCCSRGATECVGEASVPTCHTKGMLPSPARFKGSVLTALNSCTAPRRADQAFCIFCCGSRVPSIYQSRLTPGISFLFPQSWCRCRPASLSTPPFARFLPP